MEKIQLTEAEKRFFRHYLRQSGSAFPTFAESIERRGFQYQELGLILSASEPFECMTGDASDIWPWLSSSDVHERISKARRYFADRQK